MRETKTEAHMIAEKHDEEKHDADCPHDCPCWNSPRVQHEAAQHCDGFCDPMCAQCHQLADEAAENRVIEQGY